MALKLVRDDDVVIASYGPSALKTMFEAFDHAWAEVAGYYELDDKQSQLMRMELAKAVLEVASDDVRTAEALKTAALQRLAMTDNVRGPRAVN